MSESVFPVELMVKSDLLLLTTVVPWELPERETLQAYEVGEEKAALPKSVTVTVPATRVALSSTI